MSIGWTLLLAVVGLALIMIGSSVYYSWILQRSVIGRIQDVDKIRLTRLPPDNWQKRFLKKSQREGKINLDAWARQKKKSLAKMRKLIAFVKKTRMVEDEETRQGVLRELSSIQQEWEAQEMD